jgi:hypothetical protein
LDFSFVRQWVLIGGNYVVFFWAGVMGAHLVADFADGSSNVHEVWKFFFK